MKVKDIMQRKVDYVTPDTSVREVARHIFGKGINGLPVCEGKKLVGFIAEKDILSHFLPSMQEYMEDPVHARDFEEMEKKVSEILSLTANDIMSKNSVSVTADTPLLRAESTMTANKVGRLSVVDNRGNLVGILSKGDIFRTIVGRQLPLEEEEGFYDWMSNYYDLIVDWKKRLSKEMPDLVELFKKENANKILDLSFGTGEHAIALVKAGFTVFGLESSKMMHDISESKRKELPFNLKNRISLFSGEYKETVKNLQENLDAVIFMGNVLSHNLETDKKILEEVNSVLNPKKAVIVLQSLNYEKIFKVKGGFRDFIVREPKYKQKIASLSFYAENKETLYTRAVFEFEDNRWFFRGVNSKPIVAIGREEITKRLKKIGFNKINFYGSSFYGPLFKEPFKPLESDWLNVIAKR